MTTSPEAVIADIEACFAAGWTDGRPVVPPTREQIGDAVREIAPTVVDGISAA